MSETAGSAGGRSRWISTQAFLATLALVLVGPAWCSPVSCWPGYARAKRASYAQEAQNIARQMANAIDRGPRRSGGRRLANEARRRQPALKVLHATGFTRNAVVHNGVLDPGVSFLQKPFTVDQLAVRIREVLDTP